MSNKRQHIAVAIIGGGLAGAAAASALLRIPHIKFKVFESAPDFSARGAAIGLSVSSQRALRQLIPSGDQLLDRAGAVPMNSMRVVSGHGPTAGEVIFDLTGEDPGKVVHRASFLRELVGLLPQDALYTNKRLASINSVRDSVQVTFEDGALENFDAVIGCDGIFSSVRDYVLGDEAGACKATPAGFWDSRNVVPFDKAREKIGHEYFETDRQHIWVGEGIMLAHDVLENRSKVHVVMCGIEHDSPKDRKRPLTREFLETQLRHWSNSPVVNGLIDNNANGYSQWEHKATPTYANGRICILGDAAHAMTPYQGAGAGQAFEDAMVLGAALGYVKDPKDIQAALEAYSAVRRPRAQRVLESSRGTGRIFCGQAVDVGLDPGRVRDALRTRWEFIYTLDQEAHKEEVVNRLKEKLV